MKRIWKGLLASLAGLLIIAGAGIFYVFDLEPDPNELALGVAVPSIDLLDSSGKSFDFKELRASGKPVILFYRGRF